MAIAAITAALGAYSAYQGSKASKRGAAAAEAQNEIASRQQDMAEDQYDWYKQNFRPLEEQWLSEIKSDGTIANQNKASQQAAADVAAQFAGARERLADNPGVDPGSQSYLQAHTKINLAEAATSAAAQTAARDGVKDRAAAGLKDAISFGKGMPSTSTEMMSLAARGLGGAADYYGSMAGAYGKDAGAALGAAGRVIGREGLGGYASDVQKFLGGFGWGINSQGGAGGMYSDYGSASGPTGAWV